MLVYKFDLRTCVRIMQTMSIFPAIGNNFLENLSGSLIRILSIGRIKQHARMTEPYGGTEDGLNDELNIVAGIVNLPLMMTLQRGSHKMRKRFLG